MKRATSIFLTISMFFCLSAFSSSTQEASSKSSPADKPVPEPAEETSQPSEPDYTVRPVVLDENGFCVTYDEMCEYLLALIKDNYPDCKVGIFDSMPTAEFRDQVDHIDAETAEQHAHRYLFVDGEYTGVFVGAFNKDKTIVTGDGSFDHFSVDCDKYVDIDDSAARFLVLSRALLYLVNVADNYSDSIYAINAFWSNKDEIISMGKQSPLAGFLLSDPLELQLMQKNSM